jgi:anti-anti-sigma factor
MEYSIVEVKGAVVISLSGKIMGNPDEDLVIDKIYEHIEKGQVNAVLNLSAVDWMSSRGLGMCLKAMTILRNRGGDLRLSGVTGQTKILMDKCRILDIFRSFDTVDEATASFG